MNVLIAIDSLKGSLTSLEAGEAIKKGINKAIKNSEVCVRPLADGGEGTVEALTHGMNGIIKNISVCGPLAEEMVSAKYGIISESQTAIIEMAQASGLTLVSPDKRNPLNTTTYGVGEIIKDAVKNGCRRFIIGIGGSATNDGGTGMLSALGFRFLDENNKEIVPGAKGLKSIKKIDDINVIPELFDCTFRVACDVTNPLYGENGCSAIFGPQKGATEQMVKDMDNWMRNFAAVAKEKYPKADALAKGSGAAGGLGFGFMTFLNAKLESGIKIVLEETNLESFIQKADVVVTGEGRLDAQTVMGKAPIGVANLAKKYGKKVIAFSGSVTEDAEICNEYGIDAFFPILREVVSLEDAMNPDNAAKNLCATAKQVFLLLSK